MSVFGQRQSFQWADSGWNSFPQNLQTTFPSAWHIQVPTKLKHSVVSLIRFSLQSSQSVFVCLVFHMYRCPQQVTMGDIFGNILHFSQQTEDSTKFNAGRQLVWFNEANEEKELHQQPQRKVHDPTKVWQLHFSSNFNRTHFLQKKSNIVQRSHSNTDTWVRIIELCDLKTPVLKPSAQFWTHWRLWGFSDLPGHYLAAGWSSDLQFVFRNRIRRLYWYSRGATVAPSVSNRKCEVYIKEKHNCILLLCTISSCCTVIS